MGFDITHVYGLTGPTARPLCAKQDEWDALADRPRAGAQRPPGRALPHAGRRSPCSTRPPWGEVPADGETMGEIMFRGNLVMKGYLKNRRPPRSFAGGWFHTGDLAVMHPDGYVKIKDRSKDVIISGGENISSLGGRGAVPPSGGADRRRGRQARRKWGEVPAAYIEVKEGARVTADDIIAHCREHLARFKVPKHGILRAAQDFHRQDPEVRAAASWPTPAPRPRRPYP